MFISVIEVFLISVANVGGKTRQERRAKSTANCGFYPRTRAPATLDFLQGPALGFRHQPQDDQEQRQAEHRVDVEREGVVEALHEPRALRVHDREGLRRSEEHTSEL